MNSEPCISIIIPFYNAKSYIENCLDAVKKQDFDKPFEVLMVNDGSTDNSLDIVESYNYSKIKLYSLSENSGPSAARNVGITNANARIFFTPDESTFFIREAPIS